MKIALGIIILFIVVFVSLFCYRRWKDRLNRILNLSLELDPEEVNRGESFAFILHSNPTQSVNSTEVEGDLTCRRYTHHGIGKLVETVSPKEGGETLTKLIFSFGEDLVFLENSDSAFKARIPVPDDAEPTSSHKLYSIKWLLTVRVHVPGFQPASVSKEVKVTALHPSFIQSQEQVIEAPDLSTARKVARKENVIVSLEGDTRQEEEEHSEKEQMSRFSFLEITGKEKNDSNDL